MSERAEYWLKKIKGLVPAWIFTQSDDDNSNVEGLFKSIAEFFSFFEKDLNDNVGETFIRKSSGQFLDQHAKERGFTRREGETDPQLRNRIINLKGATECPKIRGTVEAISTGQNKRLIDGDGLGFFVGDFLGQDTIITDTDERNIFAVVVDKQPNGLNELTETIEAQKAFGIGWKLIERGA